MKKIKEKVVLAIVAIMIIQVFSVAFTSAISEENAPKNLININETVIERNVVDSNIPVEEQEQDFINHYHEQWKKQYEPPLGSRESTWKRDKWREEKEVPIPIDIDEGYFNISGNYPELWNETHDVDDTYADVVPDMDGDGLVDVIVEQYKDILATESVIAKNGICGTHFWEAESDERTWIASAGYDLNGDEICDTVLCNSTEVHAIAVKVRKRPFNIMRDLPIFAYSGEGIRVNITFHPSENINAVGLHDEAPDNWSVNIDKEWCSPNANFSKANGNVAEYIWYNLSNCTNVTASYKITIPESAVGDEFIFNGYLNYYVDSEPYTIDIGGDQKITILPFPIRRVLPDTVVAGYNYSATVIFTNENVSEFNSIGLHEETPEGWNVSVDKDKCDPRADKAKKSADKVAEYIWYGPYDAGTNFSAIYSFSVPEDEEGVYNFSGYLGYYSGSKGPFNVTIPFETRVEVIKGFPIYGTTGEVICTKLEYVSIFVYNATTGDLVSSAISDSDGNYTVIVPELGNYDVVANKTWFNNVTRGASVTSEEGSELNFRGNYGLVPEDPSMLYVLECINHWLYPPDECGLSISKVLEVINKWLY